MTSDLECQQCADKEGPVISEAETGIMWLQIKEHQGTAWATGSWKRRGKILPPSPQRAVTLPTTVVSDFSLQNCNRTNFRCLKSLRRW